MLPDVVVFVLIYYSERVAKWACPYLTAPLPLEQLCFISINKLRQEADVADKLLIHNR